MLFNRLFSFIALASLAAPILAAPLPAPGELEIEHGPFEVEVECKKHKLEIEAEIEDLKKLGLPLPIEIEIEVEIKGKLAKIVCSALGLDKRSESSRSVAASVLAAQSKLDDLKPKIQEAMAGPLGSIERKVGTLMGQVHEGVDALNQEMNSFTGAEPSVVYGNPSGGAQLTEQELAKLVSTYLLHISEIEETVKHVSGYKFTSAQQRISQDLLSMKKTLATISPEVLNGAANMMAMALSMGHGVVA
ncbi:unnamed protein product [Rhizoctonia solani]|uniref:Transmembrane protein n=1 Tax=Rhizoctonia solani AG-3 Rhs1AP TaxID=1086054 RepID=X8J140_9AGAM|nr:hypothetical protein RSOL_155990 [Rhizoctonia solani AG-3 Rhs1AP]CAE6510326.1 unnamed protein product [Rhizoctonia solani]